MYDTLSEAAFAIRGDRSQVRRVCDGTATHHKGYHFMWWPEDVQGNQLSYEWQVVPSEARYYRICRDGQVEFATD